MSVVIDGDNKGTVGVLNQMAAQNASGTAVDFTGIPAGVKRVTVVLNGVSTNGTSLVIARIGSGGVDTSGYIGTSQQGGSALAFDAGVLISTAYNVGCNRYGSVSLYLIAPNTWVVSGVIADTYNTWTTPLAGVKTLSGPLDRIRITTVNGTDVFDAGQIGVLYE